MKFSAKMAVVALVAGASLAHAITSITIDGIKTSSTLLDQGGTYYQPENMVMKKNVHPFRLAWGATYKEKPITLEFTLGAQRVEVLTLFNGNMKDSAAYVNNALAKNIKIYLNTRDNLVKAETLLKPKWGGYKKARPDIIVFDKPLENVLKIIVEITDIYPGKKKNDVFISMAKFWGFSKVPKKLKSGKMRDSRDGRTYKTVKVGDNTWMAQDLRYVTPGSRNFTNPKSKRALPADVGLEYPEREMDRGICPEGWRLPTREEFSKLRSELPATASYDDLFATAKLKPFYTIYEYGNLGGEQVFPTDVEMFFYPTDAYGLNISTMTRRYYEGECAEDHAESFAFSSYWTLDAKEFPLWPDENGNVEVKQLRHYRFGGSDYCEATQSQEDYHFVRCINGEILKDPRDGQIYRVARFGNQTWLDENLRYQAMEYSRSAAQKACPDGWHLPSEAEFSTLLQTAGKEIANWQVGEQAALWTSTTVTDEQDSSADTTGLYFDLTSKTFLNEKGTDGPLALPIRCIRD